MPLHILGWAIEKYLEAGSLRRVYQDSAAQRRQTLHNVSLRAFPQLLESLHSGQHFIRSHSQDCQERPNRFQRVWGQNIPVKQPLHLLAVCFVAVHLISLQDAGRGSEQGFRASLSSGSLVWCKSPRPKGVSSWSTHCSSRSGNCSAYRQGRTLMFPFASEFTSRTLPAATPSPLETQDQGVYEQCP